MDVWFYIEKGTTAERHERELTNPEGFLSRAPPKRVRRAFALDTDLSWRSAIRKLSRNGIIISLIE